MSNNEMLIFSAIVTSVEKKIIGRVANMTSRGRQNSIEILLYYVSIAGGGHHLEIGTLFGGSAIPIAILKKGAEHSGLVFCIDPLNGYYREKLGRNDVNDPHGGGELITPETLFNNINLFGVGDRVCVIRANSTKCPLFGDIRFSTAYIDGNHWDGVPLKDWLYVKDLVTDFVIFDNCDEGHPDVMHACKVAIDDPEWECVYNEKITCVLERRG